MASEETIEQFRARRRLRMRRRGKRAYIRSVYFLPSLATLGNAICGFAAMWIVTMGPANVGNDPFAQKLAQDPFLTACYLLILAMIFDALDGRLARWTRHTTDFGGQLDSMADVISFGAAPAMIALALFKSQADAPPLFISRLIWAFGAIYVSCAAIRLARFNVSNEHGEQGHMSFLGLPSPGAGSAVIGLVLIQQELSIQGFQTLAHITAIYILPPLLLASGLLMVSTIRYAHLVNKHLRGKRNIGRLVLALVIIGLLITSHRYTFGVGAILFALGSPTMWAWVKYRHRSSNNSAAVS